MGFSTGGANVSAAATRGGKGEIGVSVKFFFKGDRHGLQGDDGKSGERKRGGAQTGALGAAAKGDTAKQTMADQSAHGS